MASVRKLDPKDPKSPWVVEYTDTTGKRRRKTPRTGLKKDADKLRQQIEREMQEGGHTPDAESVTVAEACDRLLESSRARFEKGERMSRNTLHQRECVIRKHIKPYLGAIKLSRLTAPMIQDWVDKLKAPPARGTPLIKTTVSTLRQAIVEAQRYGLVGRNVIADAPPFIGAKMGKRIDFPSKAEVRAILKACEKEPRQRTLVTLAAFTGMRLGEILGLTWSAIDFDRKTVSVRQSANKWKEIGTPKTFAGYREIPLSSNVLSALKSWRDVVPPSALDMVFPARGGGIQCQSDWQSWVWPRILGLAGLNDKGGERLRTHSLRHFAASLFIESGMPPKRIQYLMGHTSITITFDRYGHLFPDDGAAAKAIEEIAQAFGRDENATLAA